MQKRRRSDGLGAMLSGTLRQTKKAHRLDHSAQAALTRKRSRMDIKALTPGFRGFHLMRQRGTCPMGMRWAASSDMAAELSHIWIDQ